MPNFEDKLREYDEFVRLMNEFKFFLHPSHLNKFISESSSEDIFRWSNLVKTADGLHSKFQNRNVSYDEIYQFNKYAKTFFDELLLSPYENIALDIILKAKNKPS